MYKQPKLFLFVSMATLLLTVVIYEVVVEFVQYKLKHPVHAKLTAVLTFIQTVELMVSSFLAKVPDDLELTHR